MTDQQELLNIIEQIYQSATEPRLWSTTIDSIAKYIGCLGVNIHLINHQEHYGEIGISSYINPEDVERYNKEIIPVDPWLPSLFSNPIGQVMQSTAVFPVEKLQDTRAYQEFYQDQDCMYALGGLFACNDGRLGLIGINRSESCGDFSSENVRQLAQLLPHLNRAFLIQEKIVSLENQLKTANIALDQLSVGTILLDAESKVLYHNKCIDGFLQSKQFSIRNRRIQLSERSKQRQLDQLIEQCHLNNSSISAGGGLKTEAMIDRKMLPLYFSVFPYKPSEMQLREMFFQNSPTCIIFISDGSPKLNSSEMLRGLYDLSNAEAEVLKLLLLDMSVAEMSEALFVTKDTIRFHLKNLFNKTNTRGQTALVNLCARTLVGLCG